MAGSSSTSAGRSRWPRPPRHIATSNRANRRASWYCCRDAREEASSNQPVVRDFTWNRPDESGGGHSMSKPWTRRQVLAQMGIAAAAVHTLDPHELCCTVAAHAQTADKDLFELKKVGDGVYAAVAATRYKVNCNAAVILTDDGVIIVDAHSKPSTSRAVYQQIQGITQKLVIKEINTHFHWVYCEGN